MRWLPSYSPIFPRDFTTSRKSTFKRTAVARSLSFVVLEAFRLHKQRIILKFSGIDDIGAAEGLRGHEVRIGREKLLVLPRGSYYQFDLIDCVARDSKGRRLGQVTEVLEFGGQFLLKVRRGGKELLVPFVKDIVRSVDVSKKELICELPQGLEEL